MKMPSALAGIGEATVNRVRSFIGHEEPRGFEYARDHIAVSESGTWAWFVAGETEWASLDRRARKSQLDKALNTWIDLIGRDVDIHGTDSPFPVHGWVEACRAEYPTPPNREVRDRVVADLMRMPELLGSRDPRVFLAVKLTDWQMPRDLLPKLLADVPAEAPLGRVNEVRQVLREVTATFETAGLDAAPLSRLGLSWLDETRRLLTHPKPELTDPTRRGDRVCLDNATVEGEKYGSTVQVVRMDGEDGPVVRHVTVRHVSSIEDRVDPNGALDDGQSQEIPWLAWLLHCDYPVEFVASWRVYDGETVRKSARDARKAVRDTIDHHTKMGVDVDDNLRHAEAVGNRAVTETGRNPADATRVWGRVMVAVGADTEHDVVETARRLTREARTGAGIELVADGGMQDDVLRFRPGASIPHTGHIIRANARMMTAAVPSASWKAGSDVGLLLGAASTSPSLTTWDCFDGVKNDMPGLWAILGTSGVGKTTLAEYVAFWNLLNGIPGNFYDPSGLVKGLTKVPELAGLVREYPLTAGRPGLLMPSFLVLEPDRNNYDTDDEYRDAARSARSERMNLLVDAAMMHLPWAMVADHTLGVQACAERAAKRVGGDYGRHSRELIDALRADKADIGAVMAEQLEAVSEGVGSLVFPAGDVDDTEIARFGQETLGTIITTPGLKMPEVADRFQWTQEQRTSVVISVFGARLAARSVWADRSMKWLINDEAGISTAGFSSWGPFILRGAYDSRKFGCSFGVLGQTPSIYRRIEDNIASLIGSAFVGRLADADARQAMTLLGLPQESPWKGVVESLPRGEFVMRHWGVDRDGDMLAQVRRQSIDLGMAPESFRAAVHNRPATRVGRIQDVLRGGAS